MFKLITFRNFLDIFFLQQRTISIVKLTTCKFRWKYGPEIFLQIPYNKGNNNSLVKVNYFLQCTFILKSNSKRIIKVVCAKHNTIRTQLQMNVVYQCIMVSGTSHQMYCITSYVGIVIERGTDLELLLCGSNVDGIDV